MLGNELRLREPVGPYEAWLTPRLEMVCGAEDGPLEGPVAKLGGRPHWLAEPFWPVSATTGEPMTFVGQFPVPGEQIRMAYLFVADDDGVGLSSEAESGDNALIVQPGGRIPAFVTGRADAEGPSLWRCGAEWTERVPVELPLIARAAGPEADALAERLAAAQDTDRTGGETGGEEREFLEWRSYVGGRPVFWQPWVTGVGPQWRFFFQLDGAEGVDGDAYALNFGGGTGYAFLSPDLREGRFLWDCV